MLFHTYLFKLQFIDVLLYKESVTMSNQLRNNTTGYKL